MAYAIDVAYPPASMGRKPLGRQRVNISLPPELMKLMDAQAKEMGIDRSALIIVGMRAYLGLDGPKRRTKK